MTSIEWLIEQCPRILTIASSEVIEQAKEKHKQEIIHAVENGNYGNGKEYYNETFKKD